MIKAKGITFGDGLTEIRPQKAVIEAFPVKAKKRPKRNKKSAKRPYSAKDMLILASCLAPVCIGWALLVVMIRHTALYLAYWGITWAWCGFVLHANTRHGEGRRAKENRSGQKVNHYQYIRRAAK
jgi:hypothetical protein